MTLGFLGRYFWKEMPEKGCFSPFPQTSFVFKERISNLAWLWIHYVADMTWDFWSLISTVHHHTCVVLGIKFLVLCMLGNHSHNWVACPAQTLNFWRSCFTSYEMKMKWTHWMTCPEDQNTGAHLAGARTPHHEKGMPGCWGTSKMQNSTIPYKMTAEKIGDFSR